MKKRQRPPNPGFDFSSWFKLPEAPDPNKSFMERWREAREESRRKPGGACASKVMMRSLMIFQAPTQLFMFIYYIIPHVFEDYSPWTQYYWKVFVFFILINGLANWFCVILYDPSYPFSKDNPFFNDEREFDKPPDQFVARIERATSHQNGDCVYDMTTKEGLPWSYCEKCERHVPPRAHHCTFCKTCILKRDHHCFMVGNCIGFKNQRYFIMLAFYAMITGLVGGYFTYLYVKDIYWPIADSWTDFVLPITLYRGVFGNTTGFNTLLVFHLYAECVFGIIGSFYFSSQMVMSAEGKTLFEVAKKVPIKNMNSMNRNIKSVFGDFWALNFLFPMTLIFRQRDDGIHWDGVKIDHTQKWEDDGEVL